MVRLTDANRFSLVHPDTAAEWDYEANDKTPSEVSIGSKKIAYFICSNCKKQYSHRIDAARGTGCVSCKHKNRVFTSTNTLALCFPDISSEWHKTKNSTLSPENVTPKSSARVWWQCKTCSYVWETAISTRTRLNAGCPLCAGKTTTDKNRLGLCNENKHLLLEWYQEKNSFTPMDISYSSRKIVFWKCQKSTCGHIWQAKISARWHGTGCPACAGKVVTNLNSLVFQCPGVALEFDTQANHPRVASEFAMFSNESVFWKCSAVGHCWEATVHSRNRGSNCPECTKTMMHQTSYIELALAAEFSFIFCDGEIESVRGVRIATDTVSGPDIDAHYGTSYVKHGLLPDITIQGIISYHTPSFVCIDFDGSYWHSTQKRINGDKSKTEHLVSLGHIVARLREKPLELITTVCLSIEPTNHRSKTRVKEAVDTVLRYLRDLFFEDLTKKARRALLEYLHSSDLQNQEAVTRYFAQSTVASAITTTSATTTTTTATTTSQIDFFDNNE